MIVQIIDKFNVILHLVYSARKKEKKSLDKWISSVSTRKYFET